MGNPSFAPSFAPLLKNVEDAIAHPYASPSFFGLAIRYEDHAAFPIKILDAHPASRGDLCRGIHMSLKFRVHNFLLRL